MKFRFIIINILFTIFLFLSPVACASGIFDHISKVFFPAPKIIIAEYNNILSENIDSIERIQREGPTNWQAANDYLEHLKTLEDSWHDLLIERISCISAIASASLHREKILNYKNDISCLQNSIKRLRQLKNALQIWIFESRLSVLMDSRVEGFELKESINQIALIQSDLQKTLCFDHAIKYDDSFLLLQELDKKIRSKHKQVLFELSTWIQAQYHIHLEKILAFIKNPPKDITKAFKNLAKQRVELINSFYILQPEEAEHFSSSLEGLTPQMQQAQIKIDRLLDQEFLQKHQSFATHIFSVFASVKNAFLQDIVLSNGTCDLCEDTSNGISFPCGHFLCLECGSQWLNAENDKNIDCIKCFDLDCEYKLNLEKVKELGINASEAASAIISTGVKKQLFSLKGISQCTSPDCNGWLSNQHIIENKLYCERCEESSCLICRRIHDEGECTLELSEKTIKEFDIRECPKCGYGTERTGGCNHIRCKCGYEWHWHKRERWKRYGLGSDYTYGSS